MTTVILTEKKSVAEDIAAILGAKAKAKFHIETRDGTFVTWARGHLLELANPEEYNKDWGGYWNWGQLPMLPDRWLYRVVRGSGDHVKAIGALVKTAKKVILATDAGREGELIGRLILEHLKYRGPLERFWASEMTPAGIKKALADLRPGSSTEALLEAARARQVSDWMYGITGTRAVTLASKVRGDFFSLGRVQTPTLALLVRRQEAIDAFKAESYYELEATVNTNSGKSFKMWHKPSEEKRIADKKAAQDLLTLATKATGPLRVHKEPGSERPPLPYSLPTLQRDANRILGLSANNTLKLAQTLYEKKVTSYPRTDCEYLAENQKAEVKAVLDCVRKTAPGKVAALETQGVVLRSTLFDDTKLSDHHAIIPTYMHVPLAPEEQQLYSLICLRYLQALGQDQKFDQTTVTMDANGVEFRASDRVVRSEGWKAIVAA